MFTLTKFIGGKEALRKEALPLVLSMAIAELFFRFHSFTLECVAFLVTWYCVSYTFEYLKSRSGIQH